MFITIALLVNHIIVTAMGFYIFMNESEIESYRYYLLTIGLIQILIFSIYYWYYDIDKILHTILWKIGLFNTYYIH